MKGIACELPEQPFQQKKRPAFASGNDQRGATPLVRLFQSRGDPGEPAKAHLPYIVDFYIASAGIVIELDGGQHFEDAGKEYDEKRDRFLREQRLTVLRYSNLDVNRNFRGVCEDILRHLGREL